MIAGQSCHEAKLRYMDSLDQTACYLEPYKHCWTHSSGGFDERQTKDRAGSVQGLAPDAETGIRSGSPRQAASQCQ